MPRIQDIDLDGLNVNIEQLRRIQTIDNDVGQDGNAQPGGVVPEDGGRYAEGDDFSEGVADQPVVIATGIAGNGPLCIQRQYRVSK